MNNKVFKNFSSEYPCLCCGMTGSERVCYHHIFSQKAHPDLVYEKRNLAPVCQEHHNEWHNKGTTNMAQKYKGVAEFLEKNKIVFQFNKWIFER